jgi:hypothetical protein
MEPQDSPDLPHNLKHALEHLSHLKALREFQEEETQKQQLNLRIPVDMLRAVERIAEEHGENRTTVATLLLSAAICDVCDHLGIDWQTYTLEKLKARGLRLQQ